MATNPSREVPQLSGTLNPPAGDRIHPPLATSASTAPPGSPQAAHTQSNEVALDMEQVRGDSHAAEERHEEKEKRSKHSKHSKRDSTNPGGSRQSAEIFPSRASEDGARRSTGGGVMELPDMQALQNQIMEQEGELICLKWMLLVSLLIPFVGCCVCLFNQSGSPDTPPKVKRLVMLNLVFSILNAIILFALNVVLALLLRN
ncbi:unnamed protein product [Vitrella brassicaformis CCMP3155]|uniref:Uncharacterized protein n=2 Tax=Vitrella brassicaformis TaxID=1169539 RepID=A0A0G4ERS1_VITBC|nr:unnamed protein product [Vitrella brassicaformis CCMP3155]|eukprot:CEM00904.1 unnamed protein product [Vitrella brassicaformis CCMP3155]